MNERIRQLWDQAQEEIKAEYEDESRRNRRLYNEIFLPKFAELIVQEVISIAQDQKNFNRTIYTTHDVDRAKALMSDLIKAIKQQLG